MRSVTILLVLLGVSGSVSILRAQKVQKVWWWDDFESYTKGQTNISKVRSGPGPYDRQQTCRCYDQKTPYQGNCCTCSDVTGKNSHVIVRQTALCGKQSLRVERNFGDNTPYHSGTCCPRNELVTPELWATNDDVWIGYGLYLAANTFGAKGKYRNTPGARKTILINQVTNGGPTFGLRINWDKDGGNYNFDLERTPDPKYPPIPWDRWNRIVLRLLWKTAGRVEVYMNGRKVLDVAKKFPPNGYKKFKIGQYANTPAEGYPQIAFIDNLKIAVGENLRDFVDPANTCTGASTASLSFEAESRGGNTARVTRFVGHGNDLFTFFGQRLQAGYHAGVYINGTKGQKGGLIVSQIPVGRPQDSRKTHDD